MMTCASSDNANITAPVRTPVRTSITTPVLFSVSALSVWLLIAGEMRCNLCDPSRCYMNAIATLCHLHVVPGIFILHHHPWPISSDSYRSFHAPSCNRLSECGLGFLSLRRVADPSIPHRPISFHSVPKN